MSPEIERLLKGPAAVQESAEPTEEAPEELDIPIPAPTNEPEA
jgi:hypothetical protein